MEEAMQQMMHDRLREMLEFNAQDHVDKHGTWESFTCDQAYGEAQALVIRPSEDGPAPAPVILFLAGNGHVDDREALLGPSSFCLEYYLRNEMIRKKFYTIVPKPSTKTGTVRYTGYGYQKMWAEEAIWALFTEVLRRLGPAKVDPMRLSVTGISLGAAGCWHLALKFGHMLAAVAPISGACQWPEDSWPAGWDPHPEVLERLRGLSLRAYHIDVDDYAGNPTRDMECLTRGVEERTKEVRYVGMNPAKEHIDVKIRQWAWRPKGPSMELYCARGPLMDFLDPDDHVLWIRVFSNPQWGLSTFFLKHRTPQERCWHFEDPPLHVDTSKQKAELEALWAAWEAEQAQQGQEGQAAVPSALAQLPEGSAVSDSKAVDVLDGGGAAPGTVLVC
mmetsp:Transcript_57673/g.134349  ORF Transcript_57673/g.134349 Transcript_57673/m.134349 type:complete len:390 (+) Transcript_57673:38-1207(+)